MKKFKVGDRVKVIHYDKVWREYFGQTGRVTKVYADDVTIMFNDGKEITWQENELELELTPFNYCEEELESTKDELKEANDYIEYLEITVVEQMKYIIELQKKIMEYQHERLMN